MSVVVCVCFAAAKVLFRNGVSFPYLHVHFVVLLFTWTIRQKTSSLSLENGAAAACSINIVHDTARG